MTLDSLEVLLTRPDFSRDIGRKIRNQHTLIDISSAQRVSFFPNSRPRAILSHRFRSLGQVEAITLEDFWRRHNGRYQPFWMPSWMNELPITGDISLGATTLTMPDVGFDQNFLEGSTDTYRSGRYLFLYDFKNDPEIVKVTDVSVSGATEVVTIETGTTRKYRQGRFICGIVYLVRFSTDRLSMDWRSPDRVETSLGMMEVLKHVQTGEDSYESDGFPRTQHFFVIDQTKSLKAGGALTAISILTSDEVQGLGSIGLITFGDNVVHTMNPTTDIHSVLDVLYQAALGYDDTLDYYSSGETGGDWDENAVDAMKASDTLVRANFSGHKKHLYLITDSYGFSTPVASASQLNTDLNDGTYEKVIMYFNDDNHTSDGTRYETTFPETAVVEHRVQEEVGLFEGEFVLMFAIDQTGSIGDSGLDRMIDIVDQYGDSLKAFGWVSFGDALCHQQAPSTDVATLKTQLQGYRSAGGLPFFCDGGGDNPENVVDAINKCDELLRDSSVSTTGKKIYLQMVTDQWGHRHESSTPATVNTNINDGKYDKVFLEFNVDGSGTGTSIAASFPANSIVQHIDYPATSELYQDDL